jgi:hypothetical protein
VTSKLHDSITASLYNLVTLNNTRLVTARAYLVSYNRFGCRALDVAAAGFIPRCREFQGI